MTGTDCEHCDASFEDSEAYDRHLRNEHDDDLDESELDRLYGTGLRRPSRRQLLATIGVTGLVAGVGTYEWFFASGPEPANEFGYETLRTNGVDVPLVPVEDAYEWHGDPDTVFVDARSRTQYENARIEGAVLSPAPEGQDDGDPVADLDEDTRIVTYCTCPHHLATLRGASLIRDGYVHTYAIDEGFFAWQDAGYPIAGEEAEESPATYRIDGLTDSDFSGEFAWVRHDPTGQQEASPINGDGTFSLDVHFYEVGPDSRLRVWTPAGEVTGSLGRLAEDGVEI